MCSACSDTMIDFDNAEFLKMKKVEKDAVGANVLGLLLPDEKILGVYKSVRDYVMFTDKRFIAVNVQGITGKKQDITSMPYKNITCFSVETAGTLDIDSELEIYISAVGKVKFEFTGRSDIVEIGKMISQNVFK